MHSLETHFETLQSQQTRHLPVTEAGPLPSGVLAKNEPRCCESLAPEAGQGDSGKKARKRHAPEQIVKKFRDTDVMLNAGKGLEEVLKVTEFI